MSTFWLKEHTVFNDSSLCLGWSLHFLKTYFHHLVPSTVTASSSYHFCFPPCVGLCIHPSKVQSYRIIRLLCALTYGIPSEALCLPVFIPFSKNTLPQIALWHSLKYHLFNESSSNQPVEVSAPHSPSHQQCVSSSAFTSVIIIRLLQPKCTLHKNRNLISAPCLEECTP